MNVPARFSETGLPETGLLDGRVALVTGGAAGIGLGLTTAMARHGATVVLASRSAEVGEAAAAGLRDEGLQAVWIRCDVTTPEEVSVAVTATGPTSWTGSPM